MGIKKTLRESFIFNILLNLKRLSDNSVLFKIKGINNSKNRIKENNYKTWMSTSFIYLFFMNLDKKIMKTEEKIFNSFKNSRLLSRFNNIGTSSNKARSRTIRENSYLSKIIHKIKGHGTWFDLLILIPAAYVVVDFVIRRVRVLAPFGSIWDEVLLIILVGYLIIKRVMSGGKISYNFTPMDLPLVIYIILGITHVLIIAPSMNIAIEGFRAVFQHILWYFVATQFIRNIKDSIRVINFMLTIGLFMGLHSIYQYLAKVPMPGNWVDTTENITTRAFSIIGSPNILGVIFVLFIPIAISMFITQKDKHMKIFYFITSAMMIVGLLLTLSRGAWLAFGLSIFVFIITLNPRLIVPFLVFIGIFILFGGSLSQRLLFMLSPIYLIKSASGGRLYRWETGMKIWKRSKLFGVGLGRYGGAVAINNSLAPFYLDNYYLKTLVEMGIYGILGLTFVVISFIISTSKMIIHQNRIENKIIIIGLFSGAIGVIAQNFVENIFEVPAMIAYFWIVVALINTFAPKEESNIN